MNSRQKKKSSRLKCLSSPKAREPGIPLPPPAQSQDPRGACQEAQGDVCRVGGPQGGRSAECFRWLGLTANFPLPSWVPVASCYGNLPHCGVEWSGDDLNWSLGSPVPPFASYQTGRRWLASYSKQASEEGRRQKGRVSGALKQRKKVWEGAAPFLWCSSRMISRLCVSRQGRHGVTSELFSLS